MWHAHARARARARREVSLVQFHNDAHVVAMDNAGRWRGAEQESGGAADREQVLDQQDERGELDLGRRECR